MSITLFNKDCIDVVIEGVSLIYLDPPYADRTTDKYYGVGANFKEYLDYMSERLTAIKRSVKDTNILIHVDFKAVHYIKVMCDEIFGMDNFRNEIIWCYSSPSVATSHLPRKHDTILWYGVGEYVFNQPHTPYVGKLKVGGKTSWNAEVNEKDYLEKGKKLEDYWTDIPSLCRNEKEKVGYATQKPKKLMERIVVAFSNKGDNIYDPFCGSGSFLDAGVNLGRNVIGTDTSKEAIAITSKRLCI